MNREKTTQDHRPDMNSRREFLRLSTVAATASLGGCVRGIADQVSSGIAWPPPRPRDLPNLTDVPDLSPPTWGESGVPQAFIYNDMATSSAGRVFHREWDNLKESIEQGKIQVSFCDYPLPANEWSYVVAIAARSVQYHAGEQAFLTFSKRVLRDFMPHPYITRRRVLKAAETAGAPREKVEEDTEAWRFYPIVERSRRRGVQRGMNNGVSSTIIVYGKNSSRPLVTSWQTIPRVADEMSNGESG